MHFCKKTKSVLAKFTSPVLKYLGIFEAVFV